MSNSFPKTYRLFVVLSDFLMVILAFFSGVYLRNYIFADDLVAVGFFEFPILMLYMFGFWWILLMVMDAGEKRRFCSLKAEFRIGIITTLIGVGGLFFYRFSRKTIFPSIHYSFIFYLLSVSLVPSKSNWVSLFPENSREKTDWSTDCRGWKPGHPI